MDDRQSFDVELLMVRPWLDGVMGIRRETRADRILQKVMMALAWGRTRHAGTGWLLSGSRYCAWVATNTSRSTSVT